MTKRKRKKVDRYANLLPLYEDPTVASSLGGVTHFAKARKLPVAKVCEKLEADLGYTLHKPTRLRFHTLPVLVFAIDDQWVADLIEVGNIAKSNRVSLSADGGGRVVQVRMGRTRQDQDQQGRDGGVRQNPETE